MSDLDNILKTLLSSESNKENNDENKENENSEDNSKSDFSDFFSGIDTDMLLKIGEIFSKMNENDKNTELLIAVKPHLREENQTKIDTVIKLFKIISLIPYLKESGFMDNLFF